MRDGCFPVCVALALATACGTPPIAPGTVTVLVESAPESLDRRMAQSAVGQRLTELITPALVTFDEHAQPVGDLAESVVRRDAATYAFRLRSDARFSTGELVTPRDVVATYRSLADPAVASPLKSRLDVVASVEAEGDRDVVFRLKQPYAPFASELVIGILPARMTGPDALHDVARHPIGAGPFRVERWDEDEELVLAVNPQYRRRAEASLAGAAPISHVVVRTVRDETTRVLELIKGRADLAVGDVSPALIPALLRSGRVTLQDPGGSGYAYLTFNLREGPTADVRVRRAVDCALDRDRIIAAKFKGTAHRATGMLPRGHWAYAPAPSCGYDPARAAHLLDEAGFPDPDGNGPGLRNLHLVYKTSSDRFRKTVALAIAEELREVGIDVDVRAEEFSTFFGQIQHGAYQMASLKWAAVMEPDLMRWVFACPMVPTPENRFSGWNRGGYCNPALDSLLESAVRAADEGERRALYARVQETLARDLPYVPLWHEDTLSVVGNRLRGFVASPHGLLRGLADAWVEQR